MKIGNTEVKSGGVASSTVANFALTVPPPHTPQAKVRKELAALFSCAGAGSSSSTKPAPKPTKAAADKPPSTAQLNTLLMRAQRSGDPAKYLAKYNTDQAG